MSECERDFVFLLITRYRDSPELWQVKSKDYFNQNKKQIALRKIVDALIHLKPDLIVEKLRKKINTLRTNFNKDFRAIENSKRSGASADDVPEPKSWYYQEMMFIKDQLEIAHTDSSERDYLFMFDSCTVIPNAQYCDANCTLVDSGKVKAITGYLRAQCNVQKFGAAGEVLAKPRQSENYITILNQTIPDLCPYLGKKKLSGLAQIAFENLSKFGKIPSCPVEPGLYYLQKYYLSPEFFPLYAPEADFKVKGRFFGETDGKTMHCTDWFITGRVVMKRNSFWNKKKIKNGSTTTGP